MTDRRDPYTDVLVDCAPTGDDRCRYAASDESHECVRNTGEPIRTGEICFYEARAQMLDEREAQGLPRHITDPVILGRIADIIAPTTESQQAVAS